jgi:alanine dehydrogenase
MGVLVAGTGDGEEGTGVCVAIGKSVAGVQAARIAMQTKATRNFFIRLDLFDSIADLNCARLNHPGIYAAKVKFFSQRRVDKFDRILPKSCGKFFTSRMRLGSDFNYSRT